LLVVNQQNTRLLPDNQKSLLAKLVEIFDRLIFRLNF
jgi:hypothetical protein